MLTQILPLLVKDHPEQSTGGMKNSHQTQQEGKERYNINSARKLVTPKKRFQSKSKKLGGAPWIRMHMCTEERTQEEKRGLKLHSSDQKKR